MKRPSAQPSDSPVFSVAPLRSYPGHWSVIEILGDHEPDQLTGFVDRSAAEARAKEEAERSTRLGIPAEFRPYEEIIHA